MRNRIFVSYSHQDAFLVTPVVRLLRATKDFVFLDSDSIVPGKKWRTELSEALLEANLVVVFWCVHSSESPEVAKEYQAAVRADKDVLPVLLDSTPVPRDLSEFQWIDFRELAREQHGLPQRSDDDTLTQAAPAPRASSFRIMPLAASVTVLLLFLILSTTVWFSSRAPSRSIAPPLVIIVGVLVAIGLIATIAIRRRHTLSRIETRTVTGAEREMAESLQGELLRRLNIPGAG